MVDFDMQLNWLSFSYKLVKMLSVCGCMCVCVSVWMLTRVEQIITAGHRDLLSHMHRHTNEP